MAMADFLRCTAGPSIDFHIDVGRELPPLICSRRDLENVILNLVASARDAMPSGGKLGISARVDQCSLGEHFEEQCVVRSEEHTSELQSLMRSSYAVFCLKKKIKKWSSQL